MCVGVYMNVSVCVCVCCHRTLWEYEIWEVTGLVWTRIVGKTIQVSVECKSDEFHSKRLVFDQSVCYVCIPLRTGRRPASHHNCLAAILLYFVSEESLRGVCDSSDRISREASNRAIGVRCLPQLN